VTEARRISKVPKMKCTQKVIIDLNQNILKVFRKIFSRPKKKKQPLLFFSCVSELASWIHKKFKLNKNKLLSVLQKTVAKPSLMYA